MDFIYKQATALDTTALFQGDLIRKTPEVVAVLAQAHQYYAESHDYTHFSVITQTCDLVKRNGDFNAPYITIAAAKPFEGTFKEQFSRSLKSVRKSDFDFQPTSQRQKVTQLLERYINNTEPEYFFMPTRKTGHPDRDLLVFLRLSIALRKEHYAVLAAAKCAELEEIFQAKLGWLKGNIYSRVATPDVEEKLNNAKEFKDDFVARYMRDDEHIWLSNLQAGKLREIVAAEAKLLGRDLDREEVLKIITDRIDPDIDIIARAIVDRMVKNRVIDGKDAEAVKMALASVRNETTLKSLINQN